MRALNGDIKRHVFWNAPFDYCKESRMEVKSVPGRCVEKLLGSRGEVGRAEVRPCL